MNHEFSMKCGLYDDIQSNADRFVYNNNNNNNATAKRQKWKLWTKKKLIKHFINFPSLFTVWPSYKCYLDIMLMKSENRKSNRLNNCCCYSFCFFLFFCIFLSTDSSGMHILCLCIFLLRSFLLLFCCCWDKKKQINH